MVKNFNFNKNLDHKTGKVYLKIPESLPETDLKLTRLEATLMETWEDANLFPNGSFKVQCRNIILSI